ncbi:hypothetical protein Tco_0251908 [Tanacetum coccineum]
MLSEAQGVSLRITSSVRVRTVYHDLYLGMKALVKRENVGFDLTKSDLCPSFIKALTAKGSSIVHAEYPQLLLEQNKWDSKSYKDKLPLNIEENPMFQHLGRYPTSVCVFRDPILFFVGLKPLWQYGQQRPAILNSIYAENEEDLSFLPKEPSPSFGTGSPSVSMNTEPPSVDSEPILKLVEDKANFENNPKPERKLALGSLSSRDTRAKTSSSKDDPTFLTVSNDDEGLPDVFELKDANACYQVSLSALDSKVASMEAEKARLEAVEVSLRKEVDDVRWDRMEVVSKVILYADVELIHSDELGRLVGKLVSSAIFYGRCAAFEQASLIEASSLLSFLLAFSFVVSLLSLATMLSAIWIMASEPCAVVIFIPLQRSAHMPSLNAFSSFDDDLVSGFASTHFIECSTAMARNFKPPGASEHKYYPLLGLISISPALEPSELEALSAEGAHSGSINEDILKDINFSEDQYAAIYQKEITGISAALTKNPDE